MAYAFWFIAGGLLLLVLGSETLLRGAVGLSKAAGVSPLLIGLLVVAAGTSAPELIVSVEAAYRHAPDLALGNVVGSNIVNILLVMGLAAVIRPLPSSPRVVIRDGGALAAATAVLVVIMQGGTISQTEGWTLLGGFAAYVVLAFFTDWRRNTVLSVAEVRAQERMGGDLPVIAALLLLVFGLACLFFGAKFIIDGGLAVAQAYNVPQSLIGLTLVAIGTSLPELATATFASARGQTAIVIGTMIGSNIFNILLVLGITASIHPLNVDPVLAGADAFVMLAAAIVLVPLMLAGWKLSRFRGLLLLLGYIAYVAFLAWRQGLVTPQMLGLG